MNIKIGCSGWVYPSWKGLFYPENLPQREWFSFYMNHFNSIEINSTFYHFPRPSTLIKWFDQAFKGFGYTLKVNRLITHTRRFKNSQPELQDFYQLGSLLKEKIETFLFQLPPSFVYTQENLYNIIESINDNYLNVLELRHPSWWNAEVYETLQKNNVIFCSVSAPGLPDEVISLNGNVYLRFHGFPWYKGSYTEKELAVWATKIHQTKAKNVWIYFNNTANGDAPFNALMLKNYLS